MSDDLLRHFDTEYNALTRLAAEFAAANPRAAARLRLSRTEVADPHVERLLEGFAFLAARVHLRIDDDFPELTSALLNIVYPHYQRPIPAMSVVECQTDATQGKVTSAMTIPAGTMLTP